MKSKRCFVINLSLVLLVGAVVAPSAIAQEMVGEKNRKDL